MLEYVDFRNEMFRQMDAVVRSRMKSTPHPDRLYVYYANDEYTASTYYVLGESIEAESKTFRLNPSVLDFHSLYPNIQLPIVKIGCYRQADCDGNNVVFINRSDAVGLVYRFAKIEI